MKTLSTLIGLALIIVVGIMMYQNIQQTMPDTEGSSSSASAMMSTEASRAGTTQSKAPVAGARELACNDAKDDDGDALMDCDDPDCVGNAACRCAGLSCGEEGLAVSCVPAAGCICDDAQGCIACRNEGQTCATSYDCCGGTGLTCDEVTKGDGSREKRCVQLAVRVCNIDCDGVAGSLTGKYGDPYGCKQDSVPPGTSDCEELTGVCERSQISDRNTVKCWES